jgi:hypothetical protein
MCHARDLEALIAGPILQRTAKACRQALKDAGVRRTSSTEW